jgi:hypothetical protein
MPCESFNAEAQEGGQEEGGFRLSCKHAFHSQCILIAFRTSGSTACPCCRNTETPNVHVVSRGRFAFHVTELDEDSEEEVDMMELMDNDSVLRHIRTTNTEVKTMRREMKEIRKEYNVFRDTLRKTRREFISKALRKFRTEWRDKFRELQSKLVNKATEIVDTEKQVFIQETSEEHYNSVPWKDLHDSERGNQFKINSTEVRHTDPWNSAFWYA